MATIKKHRCEMCGKEIENVYHPSESWLWIDNDGIHYSWNDKLYRYNSSIGHKFNDRSIDFCSLKCFMTWLFLSEYTRNSDISIQEESNFLNHVIESLNHAKKELENYQKEPVIKFEKYFLIDSGEEIEAIQYTPITKKFILNYLKKLGHRCKIAADKIIIEGACKNSIISKFDYIAYNKNLCIYDNKYFKLMAKKLK